MTQITRLFRRQCSASPPLCYWLVVMHSIPTAVKAYGGRTAPTKPICARWWSRRPISCEASGVPAAMAGRPPPPWIGTGTTSCAHCLTATSPRFYRSPAAIARQPVMPPDVPLADLPPEQAPARPDRQGHRRLRHGCRNRERAARRPERCGAAWDRIPPRRHSRRGRNTAEDPDTARPGRGCLGRGRPLTALESLSDVVEPDVHVLLIGEFNDVNFYRHATRILGVKEYLFKPITRDMVARRSAHHHEPLAPAETLQGGRVVTSPASAAASAPARSRSISPGIWASARTAIPFCWTAICIEEAARCC